MAEEDASAREEARILASLDFAKKNAQKNAFKPRTSHTLQPVNPPAPAAAQPRRVSHNAGQQSTQGSSGQMPAWKLQQLEKERRDLEKVADEERRKREKLAGGSDGVVEESVVSLGGPIHYQNIGPDEEKSPHNAKKGGGEVDHSSVAKDVDLEEQLRIEEERIMHKVKNTGPVNLPPAQPQKPVTGVGKKLKVTWVDRYTNKPLAVNDWYCNLDTRLPIKAIKHHWNIRNVIWADTDEAINELPDGFSDMTFEGIPNLKIFGDSN